MEFQPKFSKVVILVSSKLRFLSDRLQPAQKTKSLNPKIDSISFLPGQQRTVGGEQPRLIQPEWQPRVDLDDLNILVISIR